MREFSSAIWKKNYAEASAFLITLYEVVNI
jgi:hypothetical protein